MVNREMEVKRRESRRRNTYIIILSRQLLPDLQKVMILLFLRVLQKGIDGAGNGGVEVGIVGARVVGGVDEFLDLGVLA